MWFEDWYESSPVCNSHLQLVDFDNYRFRERGGIDQDPGIGIVVGGVPRHYQDQDTETPAAIHGAFSGRS